jgi:hypothetical protein
MGECEAGTSTIRENHHLNTTAAKGGDSSSGLIPLPSLYVRKPTVVRSTHKPTVVRSTHKPTVVRSTHKPTALRGGAVPSRSH